MGLVLVSDDCCVNHQVQRCFLTYETDFVLRLAAGKFYFCCDSTQDTISDMRCLQTYLRAVTKNSE